VEQWNSGTVNQQINKFILTLLAINNYSFFENHFDTPPSVMAGGATGFCPMGQC
jgi:hypothetical protein